MVRFYNRIILMEDHRWPKIIHRWDKLLRTSGWADQIDHILMYADTDILVSDDVKVDLDVVRTRLHNRERKNRSLKCIQRPNSEHMLN